MPHIATSLCAEGILYIMLLTAAALNAEGLKGCWVLQLTAVLLQQTPLLHQPSTCNYSGCGSEEPTCKSYMYMSASVRFVEHVWLTQMIKTCFKTVCIA